MILSRTPIHGVYEVEPERSADERGYFARTYCADEFAAAGLDPVIAQCSTSFNACAGTLRGLHYQADPYAEAKLVRCTRGAIFDVAVDLRPESPSYLGWRGVELNEANGLSLYVPKGCAHGFQTLRDDSEVLYQISVAYQPGAGRGVRWDDPAFGIRWPEPPPGGRTMSERDAAYRNFTP
jgi:dTDP-4-dehydrorhamnose 3,5-epimerase